MRNLARRFRRAWAAFVQILVEHRDYRVQIGQLARADIVKTYRGAALGWLWAGIKPSVTIAVYFFAFTVGLKHGKPINGFPYFLWLLAGITPWFYMSEMLTQGSQSLKRYDYLVTKIRFPVSTIPTFVSLSKLFVHLSLMGVVVLLFVVAGFSIDIHYVELPFYMLAMYLFFTAWALFASPLTAVSKDFANVIGSLVTAIFWLSGIMWDVNQVDTLWIKRLLLLNPVTFFATGYRNVLIYKRWFWQDEYALGAFLFMLCAMSLLAFRTYYRLRRDVADYL